MKNNPQPQAPTANTELDERVARALGWKQTKSGWVDPYGKQRTNPTFSTNPSLAPELLLELTSRGHRISFSGNPTEGITAICLNQPNYKTGPVGTTGYHALALIALQLLTPEGKPAA